MGKQLACALLWALVWSTTPTWAESNPLVETYVDQTIVYVAPTAVYIQNEEEETVFSHWTNTREEQRQRYTSAVVRSFERPSRESAAAIERTQRTEQTEQAQRTQAVNARQGAVNQKQAEVRGKQGQSLTGAAGVNAARAKRTQEDIGVTAAHQKRAEIRERQESTTVGLGAGDTNGDRNLSAGEVARMRTSRPSVKQETFRTDGTEKKLDANGDGSIGVSEASAARSGVAWNGDDDGAAIKNARKADIQRKAATTKSQATAVNQEATTQRESAERSRNNQN